MTRAQAAEGVQGLPAGDRPAVDTHAHVFLRGLPTIPDARYVPDYDARPEEWFALQAGSGIGRGVLVQPSFLGTDNGHLLAALVAHPQRLRGVVVVDETLDPARVRAWDALGVRGIRLNVLGKATLPDLGSNAWRALLACLADHDWHVEVHAGGAQLAGMLARLSGCPARLVFDHFALPDPVLGMADPNVAGVCRLADARMAEGGRVHVKLSGAYRLGLGREGGLPSAHAAVRAASQYATAWLARLGPGQLMWGSDWPWTNHEATQRYAACVDALAQWVSDPAARRVVLCDAPQAVFRF